MIIIFIYLYLEHMSLLHTYTIIKAMDSYVVLKWKELANQPITSIKMMLYAPMYNLEYTRSSTNKDDILVNNIKPFTEYQICLLPIPLRVNIKPSKSNCKYLRKTFRTAEGGE